MALLSKEQMPPAPAAGGIARPYLDKGTKIMGKLFFEGPVTIDGQVDGEISASDILVVGESAVITGQIKAGSVVIAGRINADSIAAKRVEIRPTAKVFGNLTTPVLVIDDGALFEGHCTMSSEGKEDRKVTPIILKQESPPAASRRGGQ